MREKKLQKARAAARDERILKPLLAFAILALAVASFLGAIPAQFALIAMLAPALAGLSWPRVRGAPSYAELVELIDTPAEPVDPIIDALSRKP